MGGRLQQLIKSCTKLAVRKGKAKRNERNHYSNVCPPPRTLYLEIQPGFPHVNILWGLMQPHLFLLKARLFICSDKTIEERPPLRRKCEGPQIPRRPSPPCSHEQWKLMVRRGVCRNGILRVKPWEQTHSVGGGGGTGRYRDKGKLLEALYVGRLEVWEEACLSEALGALEGAGC